MKRAKTNLAAASLVLVALLAGAMQAEEKKITLPADNPMAELKPGPGADTARAYCAICHSTDYIVRQPGQSEEKWEAEVRKMVKVFGAPISDADAKTIANYLAAAYGPGSPSPPPSSPTRPGSKKKSAPHPVTPREHASPQE